MLDILNPRKVLEDAEKYANQVKQYQEAKAAELVEARTVVVRLEAECNEAQTKIAEAERWHQAAVARLHSFLHFVEVQKTHSLIVFGPSVVTPEKAYLTLSSF